jgi:hypothetical protein
MKLKYLISNLKWRLERKLKMPQVYYYDHETVELPYKFPYDKLDCKIINHHDDWWKQEILMEPFYGKSPYVPDETVETDTIAIKAEKVGFKITTTPEFENIAVDTLGDVSLIPDMVKDSIETRFLFELRGKEYLVVRRDFKLTKTPYVVYAYTWRDVICELLGLKYKPDTGQYFLYTASAWLGTHPELALQGE